MKLKLNKKWKEQIYSFAKTYVTIFLGIILTDTSKIGDWQFIRTALLASFIAILRNIYKLLTEN